MRVLVIGGGVGGPVAAVALKRAGIEAAVYEAHDGPAPAIGLFLTLGTNGMSVLAELGLLDSVCSAETIPTPRMEFWSTTGRTIGVISNGWLEEGTPSVTIMRGVLQEVLARAAVGEGIAVNYGKRLVGYDATSEGVIARFDDGTAAEGDLLIGADGIRSRVRRTMSPDAPPPSYTGLLNIGGRVADSGAEPTPDTMRMVWGRRAFFGYTARADGEAWWFANVGRRAEPRAAGIAAVTTDVWKRELCNLFDGDPPVIRDLIEATEVIGATPIHDLPSLPRWHDERAVLLGDAAHAVSPSAGQGASMAIEDAAILAKCLRDISPPEAALATYEALRRPRAERIVETGRRRGAYKAIDNRAGIWLRDLLMPVAMRHFAKPEKMAWIHDYRVRWEEPVSASAA